MFPQLTDLWCTDQEFLNIQCGDWEEHAILLCNYFNYIDRYRKEKMNGYGPFNIQSFCVLCDLVPDGEVMMVLRRDMGDEQGHMGHCEFWEAVSGNCYFVPCQDKTGASIMQRLSLTRSRARGSGLDESCQATPSIPIHRVHIAFNADNVWANLQKPTRRKQEASVLDLDYNFDNTRNWKPLFAKGKEELLKFVPEVGSGMRRSTSGLATPASLKSRTPLSAAAGIPETNPQTSYLLEDPSQAIVYLPKDEEHAQREERKLEDQLEQRILDYRSMGEHGGVQHTTRFDAAIARRLSAVLDDLEQLENCRRRSGNEADFPLRSNVPPTVTLQDVEKKLQDIENDFRGPTQRGRHVYGVPVNQPYELGDFKHLWEAIRDTRILELGDDYADYAIKVRVFPYASRILSVWVFIACAVDT